MGLYVLREESARLDETPGAEARLYHRA